MELNLKEIETKKAKLESIRIELKAHFVGIDGIIDNLIDYIQIWYLMPEVLARPLIINLWGMTGVGKTDLIRRLVKLLEITDRFCEVELSNIDGTSYHTSVSSILSRNRVNDGKPAIILFDEIQRFNTKDEEGKPLPQAKFTDFWELLSDGKLSRKEKENIDQYISQILYNKKDIERRKKKGEENLEENPLVNYWQSNDINTMLGNESNPDADSELTEQKMLEMLLKAKSAKQIYEPINHSKTLIIISGNLDDAFSMANQTSEADVDPDIFNAFTQKITDVDIKNALSRKFRPEQVSRFGNIHLIYNSLKKVDFEKLIEKEIEKIIVSNKTKFDITLTVSKTINALIYRNGVFPAQGVRPLFSSVVDILESNLTKYIFTALTNNFKTIAVNYNADTQTLEAQVGTLTINKPYTGRIDKIRQSNEIDNVANISVHECGHAVVYMVLTGLVPLQLKSKVASSYAAGFTFPHSVYETKETLINKIKIYLAGGLAEELMFGDNNASIGRSSDRVEVTKLAIDYVRSYGFDEEFQSNYNLPQEYSMDKAVTDTDIEKMISRLVSDTKEILSKHLTLLKSLSILLAGKGMLEPKEILEESKKHGVIAEIKEEGFLKIANYNFKLENK